MQGNKNFFSPAKIGWFAGCLLSLLIIILYPAFNADGVLYLYTAKIVQSQGLHAAMAVYSWPFFPFILSLFSTFLHISLLHTAYVFNIILFASSVSVFVKIIESLGGNRTMQWVALLSILFYRSFNKYDYYVVRDQGYWFFILLSLFIFLKFINHRAWYKAILWSACVIIATLFRIEGVAFLIFTPFSIFCCRFSWAVRVVSWLKLNTINILVGIGLIVYLLTHSQRGLFATPRMIELELELFHGLSYVVSQFNHYADLMAANVLPVMAKNNARGLLFSGTLTYYTYLVLGVITWPYVIAIIYAWYRRVTFLSGQWCVIWAYIFINIAITLLFTFTSMYFVDRYFQMLALCLLIYVPFGFVALYQDVLTQPKNNIKKILFYLILLGWIAMVISSLFHIGPSKRYIAHAKTWLIENTAQDARIFTNIGQLNFMLERQMTGWECNSHVPNSNNCNDWKSVPNTIVWKNAQYLVLDLAQDQALIRSLTKLVGHEPAQIFLQKRPKREVVIYRVS